MGFPHVSANGKSVVWIPGILLWKGIGMLRGTPDSNPKPPSQTQILPLVEHISHNSGSEGVKIYVIF